MKIIFKLLVASKCNVRYVIRTNRSTAMNAAINIFNYAYQKLKFNE